MNMILTAIAFALIAAPAHAGPLAAALGAAFTAIQGSVVWSAIARVAASVVLSRLAASLGPKPKQPGIKTDGTSSGSQNPASFILGRYATDGVAVCPPMSHGRSGKTPNAFLTYVIELGDIPGQTLVRPIINGEKAPLGTTPHADYGLPVISGKYAGKAWFKYYDGTQTVADPMLLAKYSSYPERPWNANMIGNGIPYVICTFQFRASVYSAFPSVRFEMDGIPLYDPRKDSTVGGSGTHRLATPSTWEWTNNPIIMVYNIHLGIKLPGGEIWGGGMPAADMPLSSVFAAANACDALVDDGLGTSTTEKRFRAAFEVFADDEPASVCEELLTACLGAVADVGGSWRFQAGDPSLAVFYFTDDDVLVTLDREKQPFPGLESTYNAITASYPDPAVQWEPNDAPPVYNSTWETEDGGRRLIVNKSFPAVPFAAQVQRNMKALIKDNRRFLTHGLPFPPEATVLEPLDTAEWTSTANGYTSKLFEIVKTTEGLRTGIVQVNLRERDPADTAVVGGYYTAPETPSTDAVVFSAQSVTSFAASGTAISDGTIDRRPAILLTWDGADQEGITGVEYELRRTGTTALVSKGTTTDVEAGQIIVSDGVLPSTAYEARAKFVSDRDTAWTSWLAVSSPATAPVTRPDIADGAVSDQLQTVVLGPITRASAPTNTVLATLDMGPITPGSIWRQGLSFDMKGLGSFSTTDIIVALQRRYKLVGSGTFSSWLTLDSWSVPYTDTAYDQFTRNAGLAGAYDDYELQLIVSQQTTAGTGNFIRNIYLTMALVTK